MKQHWAKLLDICTKQGTVKHWKWMEARFDNLFLKHHAYADEIVMGFDGRPLDAVYFAPNIQPYEQRKVRDKIDKGDKPE